jgi:aromatic ring-opening dioxygenase LigB subunit
MKKVKQINNLIIKEKRPDEIATFEKEEQRYCVFTPHGIYLEDNLTLEQAEDFCKNTKDFLNKL